MAAVSRPPSLTEGEMLATRRRRRARAPPQATSAPSATARDGSGRITSISSYKPLKKIGEGAFGAVSKARDLRTGEVVAIKSAIGSSGRGAGEAEAAAALMLREAALLAACCGNPAVVALREVARGEDTGELHLVMEYVGPSLDAVIAARRRGKHPFTEAEARRVMAQLLAGAGAMHARGVVHRDLKPGNVLFGERDGRVRICDFGLATLSSAAPPPQPLDGPPQHEGTLGYIAPEVLLCEDGCGGGAPVDMWALGCVMAELVAGEKLFAPDNLYQQLIDIVDVLGIPDDVSLIPLGIAAAAPSKLREKVPEERLSQAGFDVLRGLLEYDPKNRLTAAAALQMQWFAAEDD